MRFPALIFKNLWRRKTRSMFTVLGISIGIATIIALGAVTNGLRNSMESMLKTGEADFCVAEKGVADLVYSRIDGVRMSGIEGIDGVKKVAGVLISIYPVEDNPFFWVFGVEHEDLPMIEAKIVEGESFAEESEDQIIVGRVASKGMGKGVGDDLSLGKERFQIVGVFETGSPFNDRGAVIPLKILQRMKRIEDQVMMIYVELDGGANIEKVCQRIEEDYPDLVTIKSADELGKVDKGLEIVDAATWAVSVLATIIGGIGVTNTMMMSVFERTREIGVLRALGWGRSRILSLILNESVLLCLSAVPFGALMGAFGVKLLTLHPIVKGLFEPAYTLDIFVRALSVAVLVGVIGGLYPAYRASKLEPSEALRYE